MVYSSMTWRRARWVALLVLATLVVLAGCSGLGRSGPPEPPALDNDRIALGWHFRFVREWQSGQGPERLRPALAGGVLYAAYSNGDVVALDRNDGRVLWRAEYEPWQAGVTAYEGQLYLVSKTGDLKILDASDGSLVQSSDLNLSTLAAPSVSDGRVALLGRDGSLRLWDTSSETWVWIYDSEQPGLTLHGQAQPLIVGDQVIAGFANGRLAAFSLRNGDLLWAHRLSDPRGSTDLQRLVDVDMQPLLVDGRLYAGGYEGRLVEVSAQSGDIGWQQQKSVTASMATDGRSLFVADQSGEIIAFDLSNKGERWRQQGYRGRPITGLGVTDDRLIVTDRRGYVHVLDTSDGETVGRLDFSGRDFFTVPPVTDGERFYVQSMRGLIVTGRERPAQR